MGPVQAFGDVRSTRLIRERRSGRGACGAAEPAPGYAPGVRPANRAHDAVIVETLDETLAALESAENYRRWILELSDPYLDGPILELGAGRGTFTRLLAERGRVCAVEPSESLAATLSGTLRDRPDVTVIRGTLDDVAVESSFGSVVMFNVLEHIEDDRGVLEGILERLAPGGMLILWVPAFPLLFSRFDLMLGHFRRYRLRPLVEMIEASSFQVVDARHVNAVGFFSWLVGARLLGRVSASRRMVSLFDRIAVPPMRALERRIVVPFGQSIFVAARKPLDA